MTIFLDSDFKCHLENDGAMRSVETDTFDGKCRQFIEGYRFVPHGETWMREDGQTFTGEMISPWRDYNLLLEFQRQYEEMLAERADMRNAIDAIYGGVTDDGT